MGSLAFHMKHKRELEKRELGMIRFLFYFISLILIFTKTQEQRIKIIMSVAKNEKPYEKTFRIGVVSDQLLSVNISF